MKQPIELLVKLLVNGGRFTHDEMQYAMSEDGSLCVVLIRNGEEVAFKVDCDISALKAMADKIGSKELGIKCCELELKKLIT